jgi:hypothetical protein
MVCQWVAPRANEHSLRLAGTDLSAFSDAAVIVGIIMRESIMEAVTGGEKEKNNLPACQAISPYITGGTAAGKSRNFLIREACFSGTISARKIPEAVPTGRAIKSAPEATKRVLARAEKMGAAAIPDCARAALSVKEICDRGDIRNKKGAPLIRSIKVIEKRISNDKEALMKNNGFINISLFTR